MNISKKMSTSIFCILLGHPLLPIIPRKTVSTLIKYSIQKKIINTQKRQIADPGSVAILLLKTYASTAPYIKAGLNATVASSLFWVFGTTYFGYKTMQQANTHGTEEEQLNEKIRNEAKEFHVYCDKITKIKIDNTTYITNLEQEKLQYLSRTNITPAPSNFANFPENENLTSTHQSNSEKKQQ